MREVTATVAGLLADAAAELEDAGLADPAAEALRLWAALAGTTPGAVFLARGETPAPDQAAAFDAMVSRRAAGEPFAYVSRTVGFRHLVLRTDARALIPRPETEGLVDVALARVRDGSAADIGTGTGCLALSLATEAQFGRVVAVDRSEEALALAAENRASVRARVALARGDLTDTLAPASLDLLVSNPPYLSTEEYGELDASVRAWEPALALASGADGLDATRRLLDDGRRVVKRGGWIALEIDSRRGAASAALAAGFGWTDVQVETDLFGRDRYLVARRSNS